MNSTQLKDKVTSKISASNQTIQDIVIEKYVNHEINRRAELIFLGINTVDKLSKEFTKNDKPDIEEYDSNKVKISKFSRSKIEQLQKEKSLIDNINTTLEACITNNLDNDYSKLDGLLKQVKPENK